MSAADYIRAIKMQRALIGMTVAEAARLAGWPRQTWWDLENGVRKVPSVETIETMASVVGAALRVQVSTPSGTHENLPRQAGNEVSPLVRRMLEKVKRWREAHGITRPEAAGKVGMTRGAYTNVEGGYTQRGRMGIDLLDKIATPFGLRVDLVAEHQVPLLELDVDEVEGIRKLIMWYAAQTNGRMPAVLHSALEKLRPARPDLDRIRHSAA